MSKKITIYKWLLKDTQQLEYILQKFIYILYHVESINYIHYEQILNNNSKFKSNYLCKNGFSKNI